MDEVLTAADMASSSSSSAAARGGTSLPTNLPLLSAFLAFAVAQFLKVMYDASGIRLHAGRQAELLNQIVCEFPPEHPLSNVRPLREPLGHTPFQVVAGAVLGCVISILLRSST